MNSRNTLSKGPAGLLTGALFLFASQATSALAGENGPGGPGNQVVVGIEAVTASTPEYCPKLERCALS